MIEIILSAQREAQAKGVLNIWTIYDHPKDHPDHNYVARCFEFGKPTDILLKADNLSTLRRNLERCGLVCLMRNEDDDPVIVETWV